MSELESNEVEDAVNLNIEQNVTGKEDTSDASEAVMSEVNGIESSGSSEGQDVLDGIDLPSVKTPFTPDKEDAALIPEEPTSPEMNLIVTNVVSHAETPLDEEDPSPSTEEVPSQNPDDGAQTPEENVNCVQSEVPSAELLESTEDQASKDIEENKQELNTESQDEAQEVVAMSSEKVQESFSEAYDQSNTDNESAEQLPSGLAQETETPGSLSPTLQGSIENEHSEVELQDTVMEPEVQNSTEQVSDVGSQDGGLGELTITSVGTLHGDITDESAIEAMETEHSDDAILSNSNTECVAERNAGIETNDESMEITENEESLLKEEEEEVNQKMEEMDEESLLKEEITSEQEEKTVEGEEVQQETEKSGENSQEEVVSSTEPVEPSQVLAGMDTMENTPLEPSEILIGVDTTELAGAVEKSADENTPKVIKTEQQESTPDSVEEEKPNQIERETTEMQPEVDLPETAESVKSEGIGEQEIGTSEATKGTEVTAEATEGTEVTAEATKGTEVTADTTKGTEVTSEATEGSEAKSEEISKAKEDTVTGTTDDSIENKGEKSDTDVVMIDDKEDTSEPKKEEKKKESSDDSDDIAIVGVSPATKKQTSASAQSGGTGLQISSVSGGTDIPDIVNKEKKDQQKTEAPRQSVPSKPDIKQENKKSSPTKVASKVQTCIVCSRIGKCKYNIVRNGDVKHLCDDVCFQKFRANPTSYLRGTPKAPAENHSEPNNAHPTNSHSNQEQFKTCSVCQLMNIKTSKPFLNWQGMDFCGEDCLGKFQGSLNASCTNCGNMVTASAKGKYCLRFANEVKQFCSNNCYVEFKKRQKLCECCQKDISKSTDAFVAPVGKEGTFKDFCSQLCLQKYEDKTNCDVEIVGVEKAQKSKVLPKGEFPCSVCKKHSTVKHEIRLEGKVHRLCSDPCFSAFQYANKLTMNSCDNCGTYCYGDGAPQFIQFEGQQKRFCSYVCVNKFKSEKKKVVACAWCNSKKSNFDMIERVDAHNKYQLFCSLNCLSLYRVNLQATSNQAVVCDHCRKFVPAQYHLTMSDASVRNFCSYQCVMAFQSQFAAAGGKQTAPTANQHHQQQKAAVQQQKPPQQHKPPQQQKASLQQQQKTPQQSAPVTRNATRAPPSKQPPASKQLSQRMGPGANPVISNVVSLAPKGNQQSGLKSVTSVPASNQPQTKTTQIQVQQQIVIQPPWPKTQKNKSLMCKPFLQTKATSCRPHTHTIGIQTEKSEPDKVILPVPIPFYVPVPMTMYTQPTPVPFPLPVPIPVPCFIPTTRKSADGILKQIKEIREKIPSDPLEAELLMMAEAVAGVDKESDSDSEKETEVEPEGKKSCKSPIPTPKTNGPETTTDATPAESNGDLGEDMLQMALRMASELSEPVMDLENSIEPVPVNTEPPPPPPKPVPEQPPPEEDEEEVYVPRETRSGRGSTKRSSRGGGGNKRRNKRQKVNHQVETPMEESISEPPEPEVQEPAPDANMYLKYTYGVNAWKHWVVQKNAQLEKVSKQGSGKLKMFKTDMMGCTADELNYSLCLFVKEVRKPNGEEYAPDSIFYLCLGIQQYLFENGRIDNIFTDMYYEKFTECLNELLIHYQPKVNAAGQLVCRIEEEHLWESKQLGAHSPHVLLNTLVYFNTKYFMLQSAEDHLKLSFTHIMKHWKKSPPGKGNSSGRSVFLRYYCPTPVKNQNDSQKAKKKEELPIYEQAENVENPLRCPVKLYEFYLSKCPESIKNRSDAFYLVPERSCVPDSPVWYSTQNLSVEAMNKMLHRIRLVREIQEAKFHTQPVSSST
ncbi:zinc finger MYM-type protein 4-like isoform X2 [Saccostrea echinata]|uniref:zinc finger MYM-type protein 4-like isoform X2 n=1 Tax=Saccostrea echinata TaxID=191078 RepID=UPI002A83CAFF|nr:zinc finger MYM-type protein 4-like isoform X2 [Saccostrea echinata]